jgi:uncharacterized protein YdeI (YjbR/CyaY-like superfamily)
LSEDNPRYFKSIEEWSSWLTQNHKDEEVIWVIIQKKGSKKLGIRYEEAVLEAVAHGWIDGKMKRLNEDEFKQRFTPRRSNSIWSLSNKKRAEKLISENRMTPAGLTTIEEAKKNSRWEKAQSTRRGASKVPVDLLEALKNNNTAYRNFQAFPQSTRFMYIHWVNEAKRNNTRERRIYTVVDRSEKNQRAGVDFRISKKK